MLGDNGIGLRVLSAEAVDRGTVHLAPDDMRALGVDIEVVDADERAAEDANSSLSSAETEPSFVPPSWPATSKSRCWASISAVSASLPKPRRTHRQGARARRQPRLPRRGTHDARRRGARRRPIINRGWALNEASLEKGPRLGVLGAVLEVDGRPVSAFGCDGVLVATPTGSTAWAFSAGGPIVWPDLEAILVVPNNAHALFARPMVTSPDAAIAIEVEATGTMRWCSATAAARWWCLRAGGSRSRAAAHR